MAVGKSRTTPVNGSPLVEIQGRVAGDGGHQIVDPRFEVALRDRRARWLKLLVHQGPQAPQVHFAGARIVDDKVNHQVGNAATSVLCSPLEGVGAVALRRETRLLGEAVPADLVVEKAVPEGEILVPRNLRPLAAAVGVAIDVEVLRPAVEVLVDDAGGGIVDHRRDVEVVEEVLSTVGIRRANAIDQGLQIGVIFVVTRFLLHSGGRGGDTVEHLVESPLGIEALAVQQVGVHLFHKAGDAEEFAPFCWIRQVAA